MFLQQSGKEGTYTDAWVGEKDTVSSGYVIINKNKANQHFRVCQIANPKQFSGLTFEILKLFRGHFFLFFCQIPLFPSIYCIGSDLHWQAGYGFLAAAANYFLKNRCSRMTLRTVQD